jgi:hypothetical protein
MCNITARYHSDKVLAAMKRFQTHAPGPKNIYRFNIFFIIEPVFLPYKESDTQSLMQYMVITQFKNRIGYKGMEMSLPIYTDTDSEISLLKYEIKY